MDRSLRRLIDRFLDAGVVDAHRPCLSARDVFWRLRNPPPPEVLAALRRVDLVPYGGRSIDGAKVARALLRALVVSALVVLFWPLVGGGRRSNDACACFVVAMTMRERASRGLPDPHELHFELVQRVRSDFSGPIRVDPLRMRDAFCSAAFDRYVLVCTHVGGLTLRRVVAAALRDAGADPAARPLLAYVAGTISIHDTPAYDRIAPGFSALRDVVDELRWRSRETGSVADFSQTTFLEGWTVDEEVGDTLPPDATSDPLLACALAAHVAARRAADGRVGEAGLTTRALRARLALFNVVRASSPEWRHAVAWIARVALAAAAERPIHPCHAPRVAVRQGGTDVDPDELLARAGATLGDYEDYRQILSRALVANAGLLRSRADVVRSLLGVLEAQPSTLDDADVRRIAALARFAATLEDVAETIDSQPPLIWPAGSVDRPLVQAFTDYVDGYEAAAQQQLLRPAFAATAAGPDVRAPVADQLIAARDAADVAISDVGSGSSMDDDLSWLADHVRELSQLRDEAAVGASDTAGTNGSQRRRFGARQSRFARVVVDVRRTLDVLSAARARALARDAADRLERVADALDGSCAAAADLLANGGAQNDHAREDAHDTLDLRTLDARAVVGHVRQAAADVRSTGAAAVVDHPALLAFERGLREDVKAVEEACAREHDALDVAVNAFRSTFRVASPDSDSDARARRETARANEAKDAGDVPEVNTFGAGDNAYVRDAFAALNVPFGDYDSFVKAERTAVDERRTACRKFADQLVECFFEINATNKSNAEVRALVGISQLADKLVSMADAPAVLLSAGFSASTFQAYLEERDRQTNVYEDFVASDVGAVLSRQRRVDRAVADEVANLLGPRLQGNVEFRMAERTNELLVAEIRAKRFVERDAPPAMTQLEREKDASMNAYYDARDFRDRAKDALDNNNVAAERARLEAELDVAEKSADFYYRRYENALDDVRDFVRTVEYARDVISNRKQMVNAFIAITVDAKIADGLSDQEKSDCGAAAIAEANARVARALRATGSAADMQAAATFERAGADAAATIVGRCPLGDVRMADRVAIALAELRDHAVRQARFSQVSETVDQDVAEKRYALDLAEVKLLALRQTLARTKAELSSRPAEGDPSPDRRQRLEAFRDVHDEALSELDELTIQARNFVRKAKGEQAETVRRTLGVVPNAVHDLRWVRDRAVQGLNGLPTSTAPITDTQMLMERARLGEDLVTQAAQEVEDKAKTLRIFETIAKTKRRAHADAIALEEITLRAVDDVVNALDREQEERARASRPPDPVVDPDTEPSTPNSYGPCEDYVFEEMSRLQRIEFVEMLAELPADVSARTDAERSKASAISKAIEQCDRVALGLRNEDHPPDPNCVYPLDSLVREMEDLRGFYVRNLSRVKEDVRGQKPVVERTRTNVLWREIVLKSLGELRSRLDALSPALRGVIACPEQRDPRRIAAVRARIWRDVLGEIDSATVDVLVNGGGAYDGLPSASESPPVTIPLKVRSWLERDILQSLEDEVARSPPDPLPPNCPPSAEDVVLREVLNVVIGEQLHLLNEDISQKTVAADALLRFEGWIRDARVETSVNDESIVRALIRMGVVPATLPVDPPSPTAYATPNASPIATGSPTAHSPIATGSPTARSPITPVSPTANSPITTGSPTAYSTPLGSPVSTRSSTAYSTPLGSPITPESPTAYTTPLGSPVSTRSSTTHTTPLGSPVSTRSSTTHTTPLGSPVANAPSPTVYVTPTNSPTSSRGTSTSTVPPIAPPRRTTVPPTVPPPVPLTVPVPSLNRSRPPSGKTTAARIVRPTFVVTAPTSRFEVARATRQDQISAFIDLVMRTSNVEDPTQRRADRGSTYFR